MPSSISFHGTASDIADEVADLLGRAVVARVATDVILGELRSRMHEKGNSVEIVPVGRPVSNDPTEKPSPAKRIRKALEKLEAVPETDTPVAGNRETTAQVEQQSVQNCSLSEKKEQASIPLAVASSAATTPEVSSAITTDAPAPTRDDVIMALNTFAAARGGQIAGRQKMQEVCGTPRLMDVKPEQYPALLDALKVAA